MYARRQEKHARRVGTRARKHARHVGTWCRKHAKDVGTWAQKAPNLADSKIKNINNGEIDFCNS